MDKPEDGGPAYPQPIVTDNEGTISSVGEYSPTETGMTLRDHFAGEALKGMLEADPHWYRETDANRMTTAADFARCAYLQADAMLFERSLGANSQFDKINKFHGLNLKKNCAVEKGEKRGQIVRAEGGSVFIQWDGELKPSGPYDPKRELSYPQGKTHGR